MIEDSQLLGFEQLQLRSLDILFEANDTIANEVRQVR